MPHRPGHPEPGFRAAEATDEQIRRRQAELRRGRVRAATGNQTAANFLERAGRGLRGARERVTSAAGTAVEAAQNLAARTASRIRGGGADTTTRAQAARTRAPGLDVTFEQETRPGQRPLGGSAAGGGGGGSAARRLGRLGLSALKFVPGGAAVGAGIEAGLAGDELLSRSEELGAASGIPEVTPLIGEQPAGQAPGAQAPVNLERTFDPLLAAARPIVGLARRTVPFAGDEEAVEQARAERQAQQPAGPAAGAAGGLREFTNIDAERAAAGIDPESRRGAVAQLDELTGVPTNQLVAQRLIERNQGLRAAQGQLAAAGAPGVGGQAEADFRDPGRGIASAFGTLQRAGNQLQRQQAERAAATRTQRELVTQRQQSDLDLRNTLAEAQATAAAEGTADFNKSLTDLGKQFTDVLNRGDATQTRTFKTTLNEAAINDPNSPAATLAASNLAATLTEIAGTSRILAFFNFLPDFLGGEGRGPTDVLASLNQGGFNNADITAAFDKVSINESTGEILVPNPSGRGLQKIADLNDLDLPDQRLLIQLATRTGTGLRGDPFRGDPNVPSLRAGF